MIPIGWSPDDCSPSFKWFLKENPECLTGLHPKIQGVCRKLCDLAATRRRPHYKQYALSVVRAAVAGGADTIVLCDTNGGMMPWQVESVVKHVAQLINRPIGIHAHNDGGCAVANSVVAVQAGATHVQATTTGIGERCGNADFRSRLSRMPPRCVDP